MSTSNDPLSLDALFAAEASRSGEEVAPPPTTEASASPEEFATPPSSETPGDPDDVEHEDEEDDIERDLPEADPEIPETDEPRDDSEDEVDEDEVDGHAPFIDDDSQDPRGPEGADGAAGTAGSPQSGSEPTFADLGLPADLLRAVTDMGYVTPTAIQREAIPVLLAGRDVVGVAQTGTGKTAAFGLPLLDAVDARESDVQALVLAPTRELALQSAEAITDMASRSRGLDVVAVYGGSP